MSKSSASRHYPTTTPTRTPLIRRDDLNQLQLQRNADYEPSESEDSDDELEFNSDASVSEDNEVEDEEEVLVKEELVEDDAKI